MKIFLWVLLTLDYMAIFLLMGMKLKKLQASNFDYRIKLAHATDSRSMAIKGYEGRVPQLISLQVVLIVILFTASVVALSWLTSPGVTFLISMAILAVSRILSRFNFIDRLMEPKIISSYKGLVALLAALEPLWFVVGIPDVEVFTAPNSVEEFVDQVRRTPSTVLKPSQGQRVETILSIEDKTVKSIMTAKKRVVTVDALATLGPILLTELQDSQHGYFPVVNDSGLVEGILELSSLSDIHQAKKRATIKDVMYTNVVWVSGDSSLEEFIQLILSEKQYAFLVKNNNGNFIGFITVSDAIRHLSGIVSI